MNIIEIEKLSKRYEISRSVVARARAVLFPNGEVGEAFYAIRDLTLSIRKGQAVGLVGQNGSGKSTLLSVIAGVVTPSRGTIFVGGRVAALLELGAGFSPEFTGRENIHMHGVLAGLTGAEIRRRAEEIEEFAEIGDFIDRPVKTYSSGMFVRLAFSAAIHMNPEIVLIDEALSVGDSYFQHKCFAKLRDFRNKGITMVFVSHDLTAVKRICDRVILLEKGAVLKDGDPDVVLNFYNALIAQKESCHAIIETANRETRSGDFRARIESVEIRDGSDSKKTVFRTGDEIEIRCRIAFNEALVDPTVGFLIRDHVGSDVYGTNTFHVAPILRHFQAGESLLISFRMPLNIGPGNYSLTLTVHAGATHVIENYDWWDNAYFFQVLNGTQPFFVGLAYLPVSVSISSREAAVPAKKELMSNNQQEGWENVRQGIRAQAISEEMQ